MTDLYLLPGSIEDVGFPVTVAGVSRATVETWVGEVTFLPWSATEAPPVPDGSTTWLAADWDTAAASTTLVVTVGPAPGVFEFPAGTTHRAFVRITGGAQIIEADAGTITSGVDRTYSGNPATSTSDAVRFLVGDVTPPFILSNAEVTFALSQNGDRPYPAAADLADALAARFAGEAESESTGDMSVTRRRAKAYMDLATRLRSRILVESSASVGNPVNFLVGATGDEAPAAFWTGMHDHPEAPALTRRGLER